MSARKTKLADCNPKWAERLSETIGVTFECPESDGGCQTRHFVPAVQWKISGDLHNLTITPSLKCRGACRMHINITNGEIEFGSDSLSGPDFDQTD